MYYTCMYCTHDTYTSICEWHAYNTNIHGVYLYNKWALMAGIHSEMGFNNFGFLWNIGLCIWLCGVRPLDIVPLFNKYNLIVCLKNRIEVFILKTKKKENQMPINVLKSKYYLFRSFLLCLYRSITLEIVVYIGLTMIIYRPHLAA